MTGKPKGGKRAYRTSYLPPDVAGCQIQADRTEAEVEERLLLLADQSGLPVPSTPDIDLDEIDRLRAERDELAELKASGAITTAEWMVVRAGVAERLQAAENALSAARGMPDWMSALAEPGALRRAWDGLTDVQQRAVLEAAMERIVIAEAAPGVEVEDRITVAWRG